MSDLIKNFIRQHRNAFDTEVPGAHGWRNIEKTLARLATADGIEAALVYNRLLLDTEEVPAGVWDRIAGTLDGRVQTDPLEDFIRSNRSDFDVALPGERVWAGLEEALTPAGRVVAMPRTGGFGHGLLRLAAALALLITGMGLGLWWAGSGREAGMEMAEVSNEYAELEQFYQRDIASKQAQLARFTGHQPQEVNLDLQQLDAVMNELRQELADVPPGNREQVVRAMIDNYKTKAFILQRVLERLELPAAETDPQSDQNHEVDKI
jgi:hypothetical protein